MSDASPTGADPLVGGLPPAPSPLASTDQRFDPATMSGEIRHEHIHRYLFAAQFCARKDVLDIASGEGYGTYTLSRVARSATGVDLSEDAVGHAARRYRSPGLAYVVGGCTAIPLGDASVDVVVSFETIEHFADHAGFVREIRRVLRPRGLLVISTPDSAVYSGPGTIPNPHHVRELTAAEFVSLLAGNFHTVRHGSQKAFTGSLLLPEIGAAQDLDFFTSMPGDRFERHDRLHAPPYVVALASDAEIPTVRWSVLEDARYTAELRARIDTVQAEATRLEQETIRLEQEALRLAQEATRLEQEARRAKEAAAHSDGLRAEAEKAVRTAQQEAVRARSELEQLAASRSWRVTKPVRDAALRIREMRRARSVREFAVAAGRLATDVVPARPRASLGSLKRRLLGERPVAPPARADLIEVDNPRVAAAIELALRQLTADRAPGQKITRVLVVPHFVSGGGDLTVSNYLRFHAQERGPAHCLLVLADSPQFTAPAWVPAGVKALRIDDCIESPDWRERLDVLHGIVNATGAEVVHVVNSEVGWNLIIHRGPRLTATTRLFGSIFAFQYGDRGELIGYAASFFERARPFLSGLLTDNARFARDLATQYHLDDSWRRKIHVVYNPSRALEAEGPTPVARSRQPGEPLSVLWAGRIDAEKLPDVLQAVSERFEHATFDVFGSTVVDAAKPLLVPSARLRLRGAYQGLAALFQHGSYDAFLFTSRWEGLPNVLLEVGAYGIPIVAPDVGGVGELVNDETGYLVPGARDVAGYVRALEAIRREPHEAARRAANLAALVRTRHTWERFAASLRGIDDYA